MKKWVLLLFLVILISGGCFSIKTQIANPASVYCEANGGTLEIRTDSSGGQMGYCIFSNGKECEEWAFYRQECSKEVAVAVAEPTNPAKTYEFSIQKVVRDNTTALCLIVSNLTNLDKVDHRYYVESNIKFDGVQADSTANEFNLAAGNYIVMSHEFECPDNIKYELNTVAFQR